MRLAVDPESTLRIDLFCLVKESVVDNRLANVAFQMGACFLFLVRVDQRLDHL